MHQAKLFFSATILLLSFTLFFIGCGKNEQQAATPRGGGGEASKQPPKAVKVTKATERSIDRSVEAPGALAADEQATTSFKVAGRLDK